MVKMTPISQWHPLASVYFDRKALFSVSQGLATTRSNHFVPPEPKKLADDVWSIKPPDFSPKLYKSLSVPRRKSRNTRPSLAMSDLGDTGVAIEKIRIPKFLSETDKRLEPPNFSASHKPPDALECLLMFVKAGKYPSGHYRNPKPHNFRPVSNYKTPSIMPILVYICSLYYAHKMAIKTKI